MQIESFAVILKWQTSGHTPKTVVEPGGPGDSHRLRAKGEAGAQCPPGATHIGRLWGGLSSVMTPRPILVVGGSHGAGVGRPQPQLCRDPP